jgi:hypothetical protein
MPIPPGLLLKMGEKVSENAGSIAQTGLAIGQAIGGAINRKKADALLPPSENLMERQMLNTIRRRRRALETGTASNADRTAVKQIAKSFGANSFKAGGPVNTGMLGQLMNQGMQNISAQYAPQLTQLLGQEQEQVKGMANLANDLALLRSSRKSAQAENQLKYGQQNLMASLGAGATSKDSIIKGAGEA